MLIYVCDLISGDAIKFMILSKGQEENHFVRFQMYGEIWNGKNQLFSKNLY